MNNKTKKKNSKFAKVIQMIKSNKKDSYFFKERIVKLD